MRCELFNEILNDIRLTVVNRKTFDFDDSYSLNDQDYFNITGLHKGKL